MQKVWSRVRWVAVTGLPVSFVYLTNLAEIRSRLGDAVRDVSPVLEALLPFVVIWLGTVGIGAVVSYGYAFFKNRRHKDERAFVALRPRLRDCRTSVQTLSKLNALYNVDTSITLETALLVRLDSLFKTLSDLDIHTPSDRAVIDSEPLLRYLVTLEELAIQGDLAAARVRSRTCFREE